VKTIGLIGGMSWKSTVTYYQVINETIRSLLGGLHSAKIILYSVDFAEIAQCQERGDWDESAAIMADAARRLERAGADMILICANTMHKVLPLISAGINIPVIHIADATARELAKKDIKRAALLGTKYTLTQDFYKDRIIKSGVDILIPQARETERVNDIIYSELCVGKICEASRAYISGVIASLGARGAEGVILGCTELGLLIRQRDSSLPIFDTTLIHARAAALEAVSQ
jgi:aspartate racemase